MYRPLTEQEILTSGLLGHSPSPKLEVVNFGRNKGRGVVALEPISKGTYVCEYRTYRVYPVGSPEAAELAKEYELNGEGSFVLETAYPVPQLGVCMCFDATRRYKDVGRLINHSSVGCNLKPAMPVYVRGKWRVGMIAVRDIFVGQELTYDYGVRTEVWMKKRKVSTEAEESEQQAMKERNGSSGGGQEMTGSSSGGQDMTASENSGGDQVITTVKGNTGGQEMTGSSSGKQNMTALEKSDKRENGNSGGQDLKRTAKRSRSQQVIGAGAGQGMRGAGAGGNCCTGQGAEMTRTEKRPRSSGGQEMIVSEKEESSTARQGVTGAGAGRAGLGMRGAGVGGSCSARQGTRRADVSSSGAESMEEDDILSLEGLTQSNAQPKYKRHYFWCPEIDCCSGPVQKMTQHLQKKHKMTPARASQVARRKRRAPDEAVHLKTPNPHTRSSGLQNLPLFVSNNCKKTKVSPSASSPSTITPSSPMDTPAASTSVSSDQSPPTPTVNLSTLGKFHQGREFLDGFFHHLKTRAGGNRGEHSATQIMRYVGKYLYSLNSSKPVERSLLETKPVVPYLEAVQGAGIGSSGVLHRILAHKAAVQYMRLGVSYLSMRFITLINSLMSSHSQMVEDADLRKVERVMWHLSQVEKTFKVEKVKVARDLLLHQSLTGGQECMKAFQRFRDDPHVLETFTSEATKLVQGHVSRATYNVCLGLLASRLIYW